jgi:hypothetical protein
MVVDYDGRTFRSVVNSDSGEVTSETFFHYHQEGDIVWATYKGGPITFGTLVSRVAPDGSLDMRYAHVNRAGDLMTGRCNSRLEVLADGRYRLHEKWQWTSGDQSLGESIIEEAR